MGLGNTARKNLEAYIYYFSPLLTKQWYFKYSYCIFLCLKTITYKWMNNPEFFNKFRIAYVLPVCKYTDLIKTGHDILLLIIFIKTGYLNMYDSRNSHFEIQIVRTKYSNYNCSCNANLIFYLLIWKEVNIWSSGKQVSSPKDEWK